MQALVWASLYYEEWDWRIFKCSLAVEITQYRSTTSSYPRLLMTNLCAGNSFLHELKPLQDVFRPWSLYKCGDWNGLNFGAELLGCGHKSNTVQMYLHTVSRKIIASLLESARRLHARRLQEFCIFERKPFASDFNMCYRPNTNLL